MARARAQIEIEYCLPNWRLQLQLHSSQFVEHTHYTDWEHTLYGARDLFCPCKYRVAQNKEEKKIEISEQLEIKSEVDDEGDDEVAIRMKKKKSAARIPNWFRVD